MDIDLDSDTTDLPGSSGIMPQIHTLCVVNLPVRVGSPDRTQIEPPDGGW